MPPSLSESPCSSRLSPVGNLNSSSHPPSNRVSSQRSKKKERKKGAKKREERMRGKAGIYNETRHDDWRTSIEEKKMKKKKNGTRIISHTCTSL